MVYEVATVKKMTREAMIKYAEESHPEDIEKGEWVAVVARGGGSAHTPISIRLSAPLLKELDRLARKDHRPRGSLIRHVLWEYVLAQRKTRPRSKLKAR